MQVLLLLFPFSLNMACMGELGGSVGVNMLNYFGCVFYGGMYVVMQWSIKKSIFTLLAVCV